MFDVPPGAAARALARWPADPAPTLRRAPTLETLRRAVLESSTWPMKAAT